MNKIIWLLFLASFFFTIGLDWTGYEVPTHLVWLNVFLLLGGAVYVILTKHLFAYAVKRILEAIFTVFVIASLVFGLLRLLPGGPFDSEKALPAEVKANIEAKYNLDAPIYVQYFDYFKRLALGDLGESYKYIGRDVSTIIAEAIPASFKLGFYALLISFCIGIPLGLIAALKHNTKWDAGAMIFAISGVALPNFVVAGLAILIFSIWLEILPPALWSSPIHYILPVCVLGVRPIAVIARLTRSSVLDIIKSDFIRTAYAKGLDTKVVLFKHALKNSLIPVITISGPLIVGILSGSFVIELIFAVPGMGKHFILSVTNRDYPLILGLTLMYSVMLILANMIVDLLYVIIDPRVKLG